MEERIRHVAAWDVKHRVVLATGAPDGVNIDPEASIRFGHECFHEALPATLLEDTMAGKLFEEFRVVARPVTRA